MKDLENLENKVIDKSEKVDKKSKPKKYRAVANLATPHGRFKRNEIYELTPEVYKDLKAWFEEVK